MRKAILFAAVLASVVPSLACRRVVLVSFDGTNLPSDRVDSLFIVGIEPVKARREWSGLQTIGFYDVSTPSIKLQVQVCLAGEVVAYRVESADVVNDEATIKIGKPLIDSAQGAPPACPGALPDAGGMDLGGAGGSGVGGDAAGGAGGDATGGAGGQAVGGADGGQVVSDAGDAGPDTAECGTDTHAPACTPPTPDGGTSVPPPPTISTPCETYCQRVQMACTGANKAYDDLDTCRRYCSDVAWPAGNGSNNDDSLGCRTYYANLAMTSSGMQSLFCPAAGPSGGNMCGPQCADFCAALSALCPSTPHLDSCMTTCGDFGMVSPEPHCRFAYLQKAAFDSAYCDFANFGSCLSCANPP